MQKKYIKKVNSKITRQIKISLSIFVTILLFSNPVVLSNTQAQTSQDRATGSLSATNVFNDANYVTLTLSNLYGSTPPSSNWYNPHGNPVSPTCPGSGTLIRQYIYAGGGLSQVIDYFYINGCNREIGQYRVTNGTQIDLNFTINARMNNKYYLPIAMR